MVARTYVSSPRAVGTSILGTVVLEAFLVGLAPHVGLGKLNYPDLLGAFFSASLGLPTSKLWLVAGWSIFFVGGIAWALIYASCVYDRLPGPGWLQGLTYSGLGVFLISSLVFFPLISLIHRIAHSGQAQVPGIFGLGFSGGRVVLANFLGHCIFGLVVGVLYRRRLVFGMS
jgi:hypothetical protein